MPVMLHSSMSGLGYVVNGPFDVIDSISDCIGEDGTLVLPTHTGQLTDPADWKKPAILPDDLKKVRDHMRPFDVQFSLPRNRGLLPQAFLMYPKIFRSNHPLNSIAAKGQHAEDLASDHPLHASEGIDSPMGQLYSLNSSILLLGVGLESCTGFHLAEFLTDVPYLKDNTVSVLVDDGNGRRFEKLERYPTISQHFNKLLPGIREANGLSEITINNCQAMLIDFRISIDLAVQCIRSDPNYLITP